MEQKYKNITQTIFEENSKRIELVEKKCKHRKNNIKERIFFFDCKGACGKEIKYRKHDLKYATGFCHECRHKKRPFEFSYSIIKSSAKRRKIEFSLTYEEYYEICKITNCFFCDSEIKRVPFVRKNHSANKKGYYLDRIDNKKGYTKDNVVSCCSNCNFTRGNRFSFEEFCLFSNVLKQIMKNRSNSNATEYQ